MDNSSVTSQIANNDAVETITLLKLRRKPDGSLESYVAGPSPEAALLEECRQWVKDYLILTPEQAAILAAWTLHSWVVEAANCTPYLHVTAPEKGCGKSRVLEVLQYVVRKPCMTGGTTAAALVRTMDAEKPTLLLDEIDAAFGGNKEISEDLRGILNNGFKRGGNYRKVEGKQHKLRVFQVFGAKAIAGIGKIPDTIASRSIVIEMRRKTPGENVKPLRDRDAVAAASSLRERLEDWATASIVETLEAARPTLPDCLTDRQKDISEILVAIADLAGGEWPELIRKALAVTFGSSASEDDSIGVQLLSDIASVFLGPTVEGHPPRTDWALERMASADLAQELCNMEGHPWSDWAHGKGLDANRLARRLKPFGVYPRQNRMDDGSNKKGYLREQFADAWLRYCPHVLKTGGLSETQSTTRINTGDSSFSLSETFLAYPKQGLQADPSVSPSTRNMAVDPKHANPHEQRVVAAVAPVAPISDITKQAGLFSEVSL